MKKMEGHVFRMYDTNSDGNYPFMIILINIENIKNTIYFYGIWIARFIFKSWMWSWAGHINTPSWNPSQNPYCNHVFKIKIVKLKVGHRSRLKSPTQPRLIVGHNTSIQDICKIQSESRCGHLDNNRANPLSLSELFAFEQTWLAIHLYKTFSFRWQNKYPFPEICKTMSLK